MTRSEAQASINLALMLALVITYLMPRAERRKEPPPPQPSVAAKLLQEPLPKLSPDREIREIDWSMYRPLIPRSVMTERIMPLPPSTSAMAIARPVYKDDPEEVARIRPRSRASDDICTRHKLRKVWVSKYKWRCLR